MDPRSPEVKARTGVSPAKRVTFAGAAMGSLIRGGHMNSGPCALGVSPGHLVCPENWRGPSTEATRPTDADLLPLPRLAETGQGPPWPGKRLCARRMHGPADGNHRSRKDCGRAFGIERIRDGMKTDGVVEDHQSTFNVGEMFGLDTVPLSKRYANEFWPLRRGFASERLFLDEQLQQTGFDRAWSIGLAAAFAATAVKLGDPSGLAGQLGAPRVAPSSAGEAVFGVGPQTRYALREPPRTPEAAPEDPHPPANRTGPQVLPTVAAAAAAQPGDQAIDLNHLLNFRDQEEHFTPQTPVEFPQLDGVSFSRGTFPN
ncbi:hypothetical protein PAPYR_7935 [Paratrimastix pyriformis]|uniref:Uncharacterized protein n=1 Tax=Paratrimastix pyriformis TaxID=342808 RepID=A0ABQ8UH31_9EUKA|nr:hypothetical protein PAPYR_7935 [Paratrimastix pyriformis]